MNDKDTERLEILLEDALGRRDGQPACAPPGFTARVMARVAERERERENSLGWMLAKVARPLLVSGWVMAATLALVVFTGLAQNRIDTLGLLLSDDIWMRYFVL